MDTNEPERAGMGKIRLLSAGAAHGLVRDLSERFEQDSGYEIDGDFGPVGPLHAKVRQGEPADVIILTSSLIADLARDGLVVDGSQADLGTVHAGIAVRAGDAAPPIGTAEELRDALLASDEIFFPDPEQATAGIHFAKVLRRLGSWEELSPKVRTCPSGARTMRALAASTGPRSIGSTQATEILAVPGVALVGPLPGDLGLSTIYTAALCPNARRPDGARALSALLRDDDTRDNRVRAGFV
jgi:molybdate transport system substrate-binding protein